MILHLGWFCYIIKYIGSSCPIGLMSGETNTVTPVNSSEFLPVPLRLFDLAKQPKDAKRLVAFPYTKAIWDCTGNPVCAAPLTPLAPPHQLIGSPPWQSQMAVASGIACFSCAVERSKVFSSNFSSCSRKAFTSQSDSQTKEVR